MAKELRANVYVDGTLYEAGSTPPKEIADQISNPKAWAESDANAEAKVSTKRSAPRTTSK